VPGRLLATVAGTSVRGLLPDRLVRLVGKDVEVLIYPSDVAISGKQQVTARVQAALASRLTTAKAWLTMTADAQAIEDRLGRVAKDRPDGPQRAEALAELDHQLATTELQYDEWEVLYRQRLQVERDLLLGNRPGEAMPAKSGSAAATTARSGAVGWLRRDPLETAFAAGGLALVALNAALLLLERRGDARRNSR